MRVWRRLVQVYRHGRWRRFALPVGLVAGAVLGVAVTLAATLVIARGGDRALEPGELVIVGGNDESSGGQRQKLLDQWNATHPDNRARMQELGAEADDVHSGLVRQAQTGGDDVDIYILDVTWTAEFAEAGYLQTIDEDTVDRSEFLRNPFDTCRYDGKLWALPFNTNAGLLYYRTDLGIQPPSSWAQLKRTAEEVLARPPDGRLRAGYTGQLDRYEGLTVNAIEAIQDAAGGADLVRDGASIGVELDDIQAGVSRLQPAADRLVLDESLQFNETRSMQAFRDGTVLFMRNWPVAYRDLAPAPDAGGTVGPPAVRFDVTPLPGNSVLGGENLAIAAGSGKPRAAQALIEFLTDARSQQILFERGGFAATRAVVYEDEAVRRSYPYTQILLQAVQKARPRPVTPCYAQFSEAFQNGVSQALRESRPLPPNFVTTLETALSC